MEITIFVFDVELSNGKFPLIVFCKHSVDVERAFSIARSKLNTCTYYVLILRNIIHADLDTATFI